MDFSTKEMSRDRRRECLELGKRILRLQAQVLRLAAADSRVDCLGRAGEAGVFFYRLHTDQKLRTSGQKYRQ
jgi:hypothetical protein